MEDHKHLVFYEEMWIKHCLKIWLREQQLEAYLRLEETNYLGGGPVVRAWD